MNKVLLKTKISSKAVLKDGKITPPSVFRPTDTNEKPGKAAMPKTE